jgi:hypothetical protein
MYNYYVTPIGDFIVLAFDQEKCMFFVSCHLFSELKGEVIYVYTFFWLKLVICVT